MIKFKIKYLYYSIIAGIFFLTVTGCKETKPIMPLEVGNVWVYKGEDEFGNVYTDTVEVEDTTLFEGGKVFIMSWSKTLLRLQHSMLTEDGLYFFEQGVKYGVAKWNKKTALLEFKLVGKSDEMLKILNRINNTLKAVKGDTFDLFSCFPPAARGANGILSPYKAHIDSLLKLPKVKDQIPFGDTIQWGKEVVLEDYKYYPLYILKKKPFLIGRAILDENFGERTKQSPMSYGVDLTMTKSMRRKWAQITGANVERQIAIILDGIVQSAPVVRERILISLSDASKFKMVKLPLKVGETWKAWENCEAEIMEREVIETDAGKFLCWKIRYKEEKPSQEWSWYFAPGVGMVMFEWEDEFFAKLVDYTLTDKRATK